MHATPSQGIRMRMRMGVIAEYRGGFGNDGMVGRDGFEPSTKRLKVFCSTD